MQIVQNNTVLVDLPIYTSSTDSVKVQSRRVCKPCGLLIDRIHHFASHHSLRFATNRMQSPVLDALPIVIPQPRPALQYIYSAVGTQRGRATSDFRQVKRPASKEG